jgi:hypothetical protein
MAGIKLKTPKNKGKAQALKDFASQMMDQPGFRIFGGKKKKNDGPSFKRAPK